MKLFLLPRKVVSGIALLVCMVVLRMAATATLHFFFLFWNLFLALLPLFFSQKAVSVKSRAWRWFYAVMWLGFLPNATYLITDLVHLPQGSSFLVYYDLVLLFIAAAYGVYIGLLSIRIIMQRLRAFLSPINEAMLVPVLMLACGYGMYLGRVGRWNCWDIFARPLQLIAEVYNDFRHPFQNGHAWALSGLFAATLYILYRILQPQLHGRYRA